MKGANSKATTRGNNNILAVKNKPAKARKAKAAKDPNKPKRPASAFFVFMEDFRKEYKASHPNNKAVSVVRKAGGEKWKSLSDVERAPFIAKADKRKAEYEKNIQAYNKKLAGEAGEPDKSKTKVEDDDEDGSGEDDESDD